MVIILITNPILEFSCIKESRYFLFNFRKYKGNAPNNALTQVFDVFSKSYMKLTLKASQKLFQKMSCKL